MIETDRLVLRPWRDEDRPAFAAINGDPRVGDWLGGAIDRAASDALLDRLQGQIAADGFGFWAAERKAGGGLVGMVGLRRQAEAPPAPCLEMGWRLSAETWGQGLAREAAAAALAWGFANLGPGEILAWTAATNLRSQAVMRRIGMVPDPSRDFDHPSLAVGHPLRRHVVFVAERPRACHTEPSKRACGLEQRPIRLAVRQVRRRRRAEQLATVDSANSAVYHFK